jgi:diguanylate cyclase (GGDEF)-like protein
MTRHSAKPEVNESATELQLQLDVISEALDASADGFAIWKAVLAPNQKVEDFTLVMMNAAGAKFAGKTQGELVGKTLTEVVGLKTSRGLRSLFERALREGNPVKEVVPGIAADGVHGSFENSVVPFGSSLVFATYRDVSDVEDEHARLVWLTEHDYLTGMPNRVKLHDSLANCISTAKSSGKLFGFVFIDIDHFKDVNDSFGHEVGDVLLVNFVKRIRHSLPEPALVARIAGDEFAILLEDLRDEAQLNELMSEVFNAMGRPFVHEDLEIPVNCSAGCVLSDGSEHPDEIMRISDKAMYEAKNAGRARFVLKNITSVT